MNKKPKIPRLTGTRVLARAHEKENKSKSHLGHCIGSLHKKFQVSSSYRSRGAHSPDFVKKTLELTLPLFTYFLIPFIVS